jgi:hypothetical protein
MIHILFCCLVWSAVFNYIFWRIWKTSQEAIAYLRRLHQIPCSRCTFFTGDYRLKCTVNPLCAMSEQAIYCRYFELKKDSFNKSIDKHYVTENVKKIAVN